MKTGFYRCRIAAQLLQIKVADALGVSQSTVSGWETGVAHPGAEKLPKIAALYNCTIDDLLKRDAESA